MKVILNEHVENLGDRGAVCEVKPGFARNYLIPQGLAYQLTEANRARFTQEQKQWEVRQQREKAAAEGIASRMQGVELRFLRRAGEEDTLYGSVTTSDVATALAERGLEVDRRHIVITHHIKRLGTHQAEVHLHRDVHVPIVIHVERAGEESEA